LIFGHKVVLAPALLLIRQHYWVFSWVEGHSKGITGVGMNVRLNSSEPCSGSEIRFSYFVKNKDGKPSRVGLARVLDISQTGLCMEISPSDSDLFMESFDELPEPNRNIELQIFCRSHPNNIFVEGSVRWFKQKKEVINSPQHPETLDICAGVVFSITDAKNRNELMEMLDHLEALAIHCRDCGTPVSANGSFCYECGQRLITKHDVMKNALFEVLAGDDKKSNQ
jgi:hypothetical protein